MSEQQQQQQPDVCRVCGKPFARQGRYRVSSVLPDGTVKANVDVCSLVCLARWTYDFGTRQGVKGAMAIRAGLDNPETIKQVIGGFVDHFMGGKKQG